ncbi:type VI secretion system Vgr family protein [Burkholderia multivorans]|uniref:type VI secretion system Vgr family protein n=1 Tax=Burkholderia multivorans TaxID=87883 RepID=UPI00201A10F7|nr:type VI secretion system tip protein VgrG [Burkholderia multivorans]MCO1381260.1 type VI secretion system tip protein VgrG [Burkholderia multivorans]MCO1401373.1 type VI secretion system tip protein VgrG [Burkholderia multivorans]UQO76897.1 type VI secretion system tip protein VgrG [Burkholderia multivorans]
MSLFDQIRAVAEGMLGFGNRPIRVNWGKDRQKRFDNQLALLYAETDEGLMTGVVGHLVYVSTRADLPPTMFMGLPIGLDVYTADTVTPRSINGIVSEVRIGASDGDLTCYRLTIIDAVRLLHGKFNSRIFKNKRLPDIFQALFNGYRRNSGFARAVDLDLSLLDVGKYPERVFVRQADEPDGKFIERLARRDGITYFARPGDQKGATGDTPMHSIVMADDPSRVPRSRAQTLRYGGPSGTHTSDTITSISWERRLTSRHAAIQSPDFKTARVASSAQSSELDQGDAGNSLASLLSDYRIYGPHAGDSPADLDRLVRGRVLSHDHRAERVEFVGNVRDLGLFEWFDVAGHPELDFGPENERQFVTIEIHRRMWNNLPKELDDRARALFAASQSRFGAPLSHPAFADEKPTTAGDRYEIAFSCVRRNVPLTPAYDPRVDLPPTPTILGRVVAPQGVTVHTDEFSRAWVQFLGLNPDDHEDGAGTSGTPADSAPLLVMNPWAGDRYGFSFPLREGMYVTLDCLGGDPDRVYISGTLNDIRHMPTAFSNVTKLPDNPHVLGLRSREIGGGRGNQLVMSDWNGLISAQLASDESHSQVNVGHLAHPSDSGPGQSRGYGVEARTDASLVARAARGLMLTTYARAAASGDLLDRQELLELLSQFAELFESMGDFAHQHGLQGPDKSGLDRLAQKLREWSSEPGANDGDMMAFAAKGGAGHFTPKTYGVFAAENIDHAAAQNVQTTAGRNMHTSARDDMEMHAGKSFKATTANGPMHFESHEDLIRLAAQKALELMSTTDVIRLTASKGIELRCGNGLFQMDANGNANLHMPGKISIKGSSHDWSGPASTPTELTPFKPSYQAQYVLKDATDGSPLVRRPYSIKTPSGRTLQSFTNDRGETAPVFTSSAQNVPLEAVKPKPAQVESWQFAGSDRPQIQRDYLED